MSTERGSPRYVDLDAWDGLDVLGALWEGQLAAVAAVGPALPAIAAAAEAAAPALREDGRLIYVGAGTSGRIGVQDGAELPPTFDWPEARLGFAIAGGHGALTQAVEDAEDSSAEAAAWIAGAGVGPRDVVVGLSASGTTPFTVSALRGARGRGAVTIGIANNPGTPVLESCDHPVLVATGEEALAGSTRLKAGTAQKVVLNLLSTLIMIRLGRVYRGRMVAMRATNRKLRARGVAMVAELAGCGAEAAARALAEAEGDIKRAVLIGCGADPEGAARLLARHGGSLRHALAAAGGREPRP
ncbi:sugar isomerase (SIS) [Methylobacterium sp. 4-46]|uniref:N-acetylmuramic acid 6-phosphate etherase n=1 Tax=unclassified Methylobacterium TaxID=2615210 RepID=UPI000152D34B|nr:MULTISPECIES: N-acetylmuramic acid 6-phosphate etherase [Methylobacterium]ACA15059.1 sugar isomerase (SIS) [Methylobacterium sp. 4-46]WFT80796.1 N-acetylmuramic acid 6-phosphate etherase [Methylobacterium nodulans]